MEFDRMLRELRAAGSPVLRVHPPPPPVPSVALLSGSYDPLTAAHEALAAAALDRARLVVLLYAAATIPKERDAPPPLLDEAARLDALLAFCLARPGHAVGLCSHGLLVDQVRAARERFPGAELFVVMGSDKLMQMLDPKWYRDADAELAGLFAEAAVLFAVREGEEEPLEAALRDPANARWIGRLDRLEVPPDVAALSSSRVRDLLRRGEDVAGLVPVEALERLEARRG